MEISTGRVVAYTGAGALTGAAFSVLRHGARPLPAVLGAATGLLAAAAQSYVEDRTGSSELGWGAAIGAGTLAGVVLLGGVNSAGQSFLRSRAYGGAIGLTTGVFAPVLAGVALARLEPYM